MKGMNVAMSRDDFSLHCSSIEIVKNCENSH
jgi:hypothetical protein